MSIAPETLKKIIKDSVKDSMSEVIDESLPKLERVIDESLPKLERVLQKTMSESFKSLPTIIKYGRTDIYSAQWYYSALTTNPTVGTTLLSYSVPSGYEAYIYAYSVMTTEPAILTINYGTKSYYIFVSAPGLVHSDASIPINEGEGITGTVTVRLHSRYGSTTPNYYQVGLLIALVPRTLPQPSLPIVKVAEIELDGELLPDFYYPLGIFASNDYLLLSYMPFAMNQEHQEHLALFSLPSLELINIINLSEELENSSLHWASLYPLTGTANLYYTYCRTIGMSISFLDYRSVPDLNLLKSISGELGNGWKWYIIERTQNYLFTCGRDVKYNEYGNPEYYTKVRVHNPETLEVINEIDVTSDDTVYRFVAVPGDESKILLVPLYYGSSTYVKILSLPDLTELYVLPIEANLEQIVIDASIYENYLIIPVTNLSNFVGSIKIYDTRHGQEPIKIITGENVNPILTKIVNDKLIVLNYISSETSGDYEEQVYMFIIKVYSLSTFELLYTSDPITIVSPNVGIIINLDKYSKYIAHANYDLSKSKWKLTLYEVV